MCGRFALAYEDWSEVISMFGIANGEWIYPQRYNIAPQQDVPAIISDGSERRVGPLRWGLIPSWVKTDKTTFKTFNARAETLLIKPSFQTLVSRKRCLIPATGFFEWHRNTRKPLYIRVRSREVFSFAGLYDTWVSPEGKKVHSCTVITCEPNFIMTPIHDRMPVILRPDEEDLWLDRSVTDPSHLTHLLRPYSDSDMYHYPVSEMVGNVKNDFPLLVKEA